MAGLLSRWRGVSPQSFAPMQPQAPVDPAQGVGGSSNSDLLKLLGGGALGGMTGGENSGAPFMGLLPGLLMQDGKFDLGNAGLFGGLMGGGNAGLLGGLLGKKF